MADPVVEGMIAGNDLDELLREVDRRCDRRDWEGLITLRDMSARAFENGRQMWPAASNAEYRLALEAPAEWAATVITEGAAHLGLGPLTEVVASTHDWTSLADLLPSGPLRAAVAQERVVRGEDLTGDPRAEPGFAEAALRLCAWEHPYPVATYKPGSVEAPPPEVAVAAGAIRVAADPRSGPRDHEVVALEELALTWVSQSNGIARAVAVEGDGPTAVAALLDDGSALARPAEGGEVLALWAWAAASGGAHGRRRGMASGRATAWWTAAVLAGLDERWPPEPDELGGAVAELGWWVWSTPGETGWTCRVAVADAEEGLAWALDASDRE